MALFDCHSLRSFCITRNIAKAFRPPLLIFTFIIFFFLFSHKFFFFLFSHKFLRRYVNYTYPRRPTRIINSYSASHGNWCTATLWNRIMTAQCEGMGEVGSARYEPALLPPCPSVRVLSYSDCQEIHSRQQTGLAVLSVKDTICNHQVGCLVLYVLWSDLAVICNCNRVRGHSWLLMVLSRPDIVQQH